jgi:glucokinase
MTHLIGIDLGGTKIAGAIYDPRGETLLHRQTIPTESMQGPDAVLERVASLCRQLCQTANLPLSDIQAVGVGFPGTLDYAKGLSILVTNLPGEWTEKPIQAILQTHLGRPVYVVNDARAFTLAEALRGAGRGYETVLGVTLGTGIGGGIVINGKLHLGLDGGAGEIGNHTVDFNGLPDGSGTPGGLEGYASGPAIAALGAKAVMQGVDTQIGALVNYDLNKITPAIIMQAAQNGDGLAQDILTYAGTIIGAGIANAVTLIAPNCIVIGGGVTKLGEWILQPIRQGIRRYNHTVIFEHLSIQVAQLGDEAGIIGAALWAEQKTEMS